MKPWLLRLHRWITLLFALPLAAVIVTGLMLSFEPIAADRHFTGRSIKLTDVEAALQKHDPDRKATTLNVRAYENAIVLQAGRGEPPIKIDLATGQRIDPSQRSWSDTLVTARRLHETLLLDAKWLVDAATIAMLVSMIFGLLMGLPFFRNTLGGWHRATAWILAPLLLLSPLTGIAIAFGVTLADPPPRPKADSPPIPLADAIKLVAAKHDLAGVVWIRRAGGALRARIYDGREANVFLVTRDGLVPGARNWPRALHEGVWAGVYSGLANVVTSVALIGLFMTGLTIWARRTLRRASRRSGGIRAEA